VMLDQKPHLRRGSSRGEGELRMWDKLLIDGDDAVVVLRKPRRENLCPNAESESVI